MKYIITSIRRKNTIISFMRFKWPLFVKSWVTFAQGYFVPSLVEIGPMVLKKKIFELGKRISTFFLLLYLLGKGHGPSFEKKKNLLYPRMLWAKFGWSQPSGSGEEDENVESLQRDRLTDRRTTGDQKNSLELSAQVS